MTMQQYCLKWNNHQPNFISVFSSLLNSESLVDVTLSAEGRHVQAHKLVLSACSSYFQSLFTMNPCQHPIVILKDVKFTDLKVMVDFMYYGEVNVSQEQLPHILKTAETLKIKGLAEVPMESSLSRHNNSLDRTEGLSTGDTNWSSDGQRQSMTPSPCPLSPGTRRKRLRKSSTGSGSGSTERQSEEHPGSDSTLTSPTNTTLGTVIKPDPGGFSTESGTPIRIKQHSSDSDMHRSSSRDSESEPTHQITLQIPQQEVNVQHNIEPSTSLIDMTAPSSSSSQTISGFQWVDHGYSTAAHFAQYQPAEAQYAPPSNATILSHGNYGSCDQVQYQVQQQQQQQPAEQKPPPGISSVPAQIMKRKRSLNPQADENFIRALEAVRFGGIGFCKAARIFGVNNRTLWLEYKKRGYPINRLSIKNRKLESQQTAANFNQSQQQTAQPKQEQPQPQQQQQQQQQSPQSIPQTTTVTTATNSSVQQQETTEVIISNPIAMISSAFLEGRPVEISPVFQRSRYFDGNGIINGQNMNVSNRTLVTTHVAQPSPQQQQQSQLGTKRSRVLMRQTRVKRESDPPSQGGTDPDPPSPHFLAVPHVRVERQCSDPLPVHSPPPSALLGVPGNVLVKQHSHPLLPSQLQQTSTPPTPLHIQLQPQTHSNEGDRAMSPMIVFSDPLATSPKEILPQRSESFPTETTATLRVRTDELRRSASSPQTGTRSSHCPVIRPGPALGCNYCWNTVDAHGRILRRKTKYHCPECQTNLCIVPCFQEYHERHVATASHADPVALTTSVMKAFPKTSSI